MEALIALRAGEVGSRRVHLVRQAADRQFGPRHDDARGSLRLSERADARGGQQPCLCRTGRAPAGWWELIVRLAGDEPGLGVVDQAAGELRLLGAGGTGGVEIGEAVPHRRCAAERTGGASRRDICIHRASLGPQSPPAAASSARRRRGTRPQAETGVRRSGRVGDA